ncbi:MAG: hypothetical protein K0B05_13170 [Bacteroidales bacterium]|nr:hypothetical protein [Bacteroidales bacterium]
MIRFRAQITAIRLKFIVMFLLIPVAAWSQTRSQKKKIFNKAESYYLYEDYDMANPLYLLLETPENSNVQYKIGTSYLNITDEKEKAIPYLESAVKNTSFKARIRSHSEKRAPLDAWFFLAKAYMINNEPDLAIATFNNFKKLAAGPEVKGEMKNLAFVDQLMQACRNATLFQENPVPMTMSTLGSGLNQGAVNGNPAVSHDGNTLVYTERRGMLNVILWSTRRDGVWQPPVDITDDLNAGRDGSSCSLNHDGTELFLYKSDNYDGNIYSAEYRNGKWNPAKRLNRNINTKFYESHASVSADGNRLYFTSNRTGGHGGLDLYVSGKDATGDWGPAINLGSAVNTPFNEDTPFTILNDSLLYFSSEGHSSMGGFDIFRSVKTGSAFGTPQNLGSPVNTTDDDKFLQPWDNGRYGFYSQRTDYKKWDIYFLDFTTAGDNRIFEIRGTLSLQDTTVDFDEKYAIHLTDRTTGDTLDVGYPNKNTGQYSFIVAGGKFRIAFTGEGYLTHTIDTAIAPDSYRKIFNFDVNLLKDPDYLGKPGDYERIDLSVIPPAEAIDAGMIRSDLQLSDLGDTNIADSEILFYTVQVMALYNPVDISYFRYVSDIKVIYNENDLFYRYTTGEFLTREEAYAHKDDLIMKGYPDDLFIKKVSKIPGDRPVRDQVYFTIQLKATKIRVDMNRMFRAYSGVRETEEIDGLYHYLYGKFDTFSEAAKVLEKITDKEFEDAFVREVKVLIR